MSIAFSDLIARLEELVPAQDGTPSPSQYEDAVRDAVYAFSERAGMMRIHEFSVVSGTAEYTLPDGFIRLVKLEPLFGGVRMGNVALTGAGIVPLNNIDEEETFTINGRVLTFYPTPTYSATRWLRYKAAHVLDSSDNYPYLTDQTVGIIMLKAQAYAWRQVGARTGREGWKYTFGDVTIDMTNLGKALQTWIADYDTDFDTRMSRFTGPSGQLA